MSNIATPKKCDSIRDIKKKQRLVGGELTRGNGYTENKENTFFLLYAFIKSFQIYLHHSNKLYDHFKNLKIVRGRD